MNYKLMNRQIMKQQAKMFLRLQYKKFLQLNLISIILNIIYYTSINLVGFYMVLNYTPNEILQMAGSEPVTSGPMSQTVLLMGFELFAAMIKIGVQYTILDYLFDIGDKNIEHPFVDATRVFSRDYFLNIILLWLSSYLLVQYGLMVFIIPGVYLYLIFSQIFFVYRHSRLDKHDLGILGTFTASNSLMKGFRIKYLLLDLSFIGWDILNGLTCGLLSIWLVPYKNMTYTLFYKNLVQIRSTEQQ